MEEESGVAATTTEQTGFDPFTLEVLWTRSIAIADEMAATLVRTAFSTIIRINYDFACGIFDEHGELIAQASHCAPGQLGSMPTVMRDFLNVYPVDMLHPGDVLITNDPWIGSGHSPDIYLATPIFQEGALVGFACNSAHHMDVGGALHSDTRDVHEEGLLIPISKLYHAGREDDMLIRLIKQNVRLPDKTMGDLRAQLAANFIASRRVCELIQEYRLKRLSRLAHAISDQTEKAMRLAIRQIPNGAYQIVYPLEERGRHGEGLVIHLELSVHDDRAVIDFTGSSDQVERPINCVLNYTRSYSIVGLKMALCPDLPYNAGIQRPVDVMVPEGNLLNARFPIAVAGRTAIGQLIPEVVFGALAQAIPDRVIAGCGSVPMWVFKFVGQRADGRRFHEGSHAMGGLGARPNKDGLSTVAFPYNLADTPSEVIESETGLILWEERKFIANSGGPGRFRGGQGQRVTLHVLDVEGEAGIASRLLFSTQRGRYERGPVGLLGGADGSRGAVFLNESLVPFDQHDMELVPGDRVTLQLPGGGGMYSPFERDPQRVRADAIAGRVTIASARADYGVVIDPSTFDVDVDASRQLRARGLAGKGAPTSGDPS
jgi:N-methylhydantoinase B